MAHIVSEMSAFSTYCTLCHDLHLLVWFKSSSKVISFKLILAYFIRYKFVLQGENEKNCKKNKYLFIFFLIWYKIYITMALSKEKAFVMGFL